MASKVASIPCGCIEEAIFSSIALSSCVVSNLAVSVMVSKIVKVISKTLNFTFHRIVDTRLIFILLCFEPLARGVLRGVDQR